MVVQNNRMFVADRSKTVCFTLPARREVEKGTNVQRPSPIPEEKQRSLGALLGEAGKGWHDWKAKVQHCAVSMMG